MSIIKEEFLDINDDNLSATFNEDTETNLSMEGVSNDHIEDEVLMRLLLQQFEMEFLQPILKDADISYRQLRFLSADDINAAIRSVGNRAEFREKLFAWRREKYKTSDITIEGDKTLELPFEPRPILFSENKQRAAITKNSMLKETTKSEEQSELESTPTPIDPSTTTPLAVPFGSVINLSSIIDKAQFGTMMKEFYKKHGYLQRKHRDELIQIIMNHIIANDIKLHCSDFDRITSEIVSVFPSEEEAKDYYFMRRSGKRNPTGRLFSKYNNSSKRRRMNCSLDIASSTNSSSTAAHETDVDEETSTLDETSVTAIKSFLRCDGIDWEDVCTMWLKTYQARQKDLMRCATIREFLSQWPKYLMPNGAELFCKDFNCKYPSKTDLLHTKWQEFKPKIYCYYSLNINNDVCKSLLAICFAKPSKNVENYLLATLLNAIMPPSARFRDSSGTNKRKASIADAIDWFVIRVPHIDQISQRRQELLEKYGSTDSECAPYIVAIGENNVDISGFYVSFMKSLYPLPDFLSALDICLKIFRVLSIPYPPTTLYTWTFIQRYFYEIYLPDDAKSPALISLYSHLTHT